MRTAQLALIGAALLAATPAGAAPAPPAARASAAAAADGRCILVLNVVARDPKNRDGALRGQFYYLGRLTGRGQLNELEGILLASSKGLSGPNQLQSELKRCGGELNAAGAKMGQAFQALQQMSQAQPAPSAPAPGGPAPLFPPAPNLTPGAPPPK